jgi:hypothetical protein
VSLLAKHIEITAPSRIYLVQYKLPKCCITLWFQLSTTKSIKWTSYKLYMHEVYKHFFFSYLNKIFVGLSDRRNIGLSEYRNVWLSDPQNIIQISIAFTLDKIDKILRNLYFNRLFIFPFNQTHIYKSSRNTRKKSIYNKTVLIKLCKFIKIIEKGICDPGWNIPTIIYLL